MVRRSVVILASLTVNCDVLAYSIHRHPRWVTSARKMGTLPTVRSASGNPSSFMRFLEVEGLGPTPSQEQKMRAAAAAQLIADEEAAAAAAAAAAEVDTRVRAEERAEGEQRATLKTAAEQAAAEQTAATKPAAVKQAAAEQAAAEQKAATEQAAVEQAAAEQAAAQVAVKHAVAEQAKAEEAEQTAVDQAVAEQDAVQSATEQATAEQASADQAGYEQAAAEQVAAEEAAAEQGEVFCLAAEAAAREASSPPLVDSSPGETTSAQPAGTMLEPDASPGSAPNAEVSSIVYGEAESVANHQETDFDDLLSAPLVAGSQANTRGGTDAAVEPPQLFARCARCKSVYLLQPSVVGGGKRVSCSVCGHAWWQTASRLEEVRGVL